MPQSNQPSRGDWKSGTFECCDDCTDCLFAWICNPCYRYLTVKDAGESTICAILVCLFPLGLCCVRSNVRERKGIEGSAINDFLCVWLCHLCTMIQLRKEVKN